MHDVIVVGAGVMGSAAAYQLAKDGRQVLLLEQFQIGHTRGSSHGGSRITRSSP
jgi:glycine/D-amino acid oxidase-like deaminating enzyme